MYTKNFKIKEIKAEKGEGSAIIAELNVIDSDGDVTLPGAFGVQEVNILPAHDRMAPRLGKAVLKEDGDYAIADFKFNLDNDAVMAKEWYSALKFDMSIGQPLQEWSYGFNVVDAEYGEFQGQKVRFLKSLSVHEISPVLKGAGVGTGTLSIKSEGVKMTFEQELENAVNGLDAVSRLIKRSGSLMELRVQKGKGFSEASFKELLKINDLFLKTGLDFNDLIKKLSPEEELDVDSLYATFQEIKFKHLQEV